MAAAGSLQQAAGLAYSNLNALWITGAPLKTKTALFCTDLLVTFPDSNISSRPIADWITVLSAISDAMPSGTPPIATLVDAAQALYRLCWLTSSLNTQTPQQVTNTQSTAVLTAYNARFA